MVSFVGTTYTLTCRQGQKERNDTGTDVGLWVTIHIDAHNNMQYISGKPHKLSQ